MAVTVVTGRYTDNRARSLAATRGGKVAMTTYNELVSSDLHLSRLIKGDPHTIIVRDTPWAGYVFEFIRTISRTKSIVCDLPGMYPTPKAMPDIIFCIGVKDDEVVRFIST